MHNVQIQFPNFQSFSLKQALKAHKKFPKFQSFKKIKFWES
jgi:hypothetical protein